MSRLRRSDFLFCVGRPHHTWRNIMAARNNNTVTDIASQFKAIRIAPAVAAEKKDEVPLPLRMYGTTAIVSQATKLTFRGFVDGWKSV